MSAKLTKTQQMVLDYIVGYIAVHGFPPTNFNISDEFDWKSPNSANCHLVCLKRKGYISIAKGISRGIKVIEQEEPQVEYLY